MIGRRCKAGDSLSRAALIARALTRRIPAGAASCAWRVQLRKVDQDTRSVKLAVRPPGHAERFPFTWEAISSSSTSAAHRSAAMAGGARPDPFRTRKLSRRAPMVLRGQPVGEQGAADRWTALDPYIAGSGAGAPRGIPSRGAPFLSLSPSELAGPRGLFSWAASCLVCRSARTGRASFRPRGSSALRPIHLARPPAVFSRPGPFLRLSALRSVRWALARFPLRGGGT